MPSRKTMLIFGIAVLTAIIGIAAASSYSSRSESSGFAQQQSNNFAQQQFNNVLEDLNDESSGGYAGQIESDGEYHRPGNPFGSDGTPGSLYGYEGDKYPSVGD